MRVICRHFLIKLAENGSACHVEAKEGVEVKAGVDDEDRKGSSSEVAMEGAGGCSTHWI